MVADNDTATDMSPDGLVGRVARLRDSMKKLKLALDTGNPDEIVRTAEHACRIIVECGNCEIPGPAADSDDGRKLMELIGETKRLVRLEMIVATAKLRTNARVIASLLGTSAYDRSGERVVGAAAPGLAAMG